MDPGRDTSASGSTAPRTLARRTSGTVAVVVAVVAVVALVGAAVVLVTARHRSVVSTGATGGAASTSTSSSSTVDTAVASTSAVETSPSTATTAAGLWPTPPTAVDPWSIAWLTPTAVPDGVTLRTATVLLAAPDCPSNADCVGMVPAAQLRWESTDWRVSRSINLSELLATAGSPPTTLAATTRSAGERKVQVVAAGNGPSMTITATWAEGDHEQKLMLVTAFGLAWDAVDSFIAGLHLTDAPSFAQTSNPPLEPCIDAPLQYALATPAGWIRHVEQAQPSGYCGVGIASMVSVVKPGVGDQPGRLITVVTKPATDGTVASMQGDPVRVGDHDGQIVAGRLVFVAGDVVVDVHGDATPEELVAVGLSVYQLDDVDWAELVGSVEHG